MLLSGLCYFPGCVHVRVVSVRLVSVRFVLLSGLCQCPGCVCPGCVVVPEGELRRKKRTLGGEEHCTCGEQLGGTLHNIVRNKVG